MSKSSRLSADYAPRGDSLSSNHRPHLSRDGSSLRRRAVVGVSDAYTYALRTAYLAYLLNAKTKRSQLPPPAAPAPAPRSSTSINDLMKDFSLIRDSKSSRFPHGFMAELERRLMSVVMGKERRAEYGDAAVKRSFAAFYNAFSEPGFKKRMEKDRKVEDLVLIFFSSATKEQSKGKQPGEDSWKGVVDRHLALFVRLISLVLKEQDWARDRPELSGRLTTLEQKLLSNDQNLASAPVRNGTGSNGTAEGLPPISYDVKDMHLVQIVGRVFGLRNAMMQSDVDKNKVEWTDKAALQDLKIYQAQLTMKSKRVLRSEDFDLEEAYEKWKKGETHDVSQMILAILKANPALAKTTSGTPAALQASAANAAADGGQYPDSLWRADSRESGNYAFDQPVDMSTYSGGRSSFEQLDEDATDSLTFTPAEPRAFFAVVMAEALNYDLQEQLSQSKQLNSDIPAPTRLLSMPSVELLNELASRWRIPPITRAIVFLEAVKAKFIDQEVSLEGLDTAFTLVKEQEHEKAKYQLFNTPAFHDRNSWTLVELTSYRQILSDLHVALLRDLFEILQKAYEKGSPSPAPTIIVLDDHILSDPAFSESDEKIQEYKNNLHEGLTSRAYELYRELLEKEVPSDQNEWEFLHVVNLGKAVGGVVQRTQKKYRKSPDVLGVFPLHALVETVLPLFAQDAKGIIERILIIAKERDEEVPVEDGFILYGELVEIRQLHGEVLPDEDFAFHVEGLMADFVWRWIKMTESTITDWVDEAIKQDTFATRSEEGAIPTEDQRHSVSVIDIFSSFKQTIDRIVQLNWDDDLQYAKFMTALASVVGRGIARYCDVLEQRFVKEMDRLAPEQDSAKSQSTQEKWLAMAKDAWNNKEKIEPFQFYPESFVKLNDIDFAAKQLDRLEREVNVEACAEVIQKHAPPVTQRQRKITNYVFTVKIVEAEDLKACDVSGFSDPYVVLGDEYQKRLAKTRVIYRNLNPRWDESVDILTQGPLNVVATVWDWDAMGDHDCAGRASLKLDPSHFGDFLPREYWLDLDTQGRILLRVSMEGERDDIQFYFGKAFRHLKRTERDMTRTITDKLSAYISYSLSKRTLRSLLSKGVNLANVTDKLTSVSSYFNKIKPLQTPSQPPTEAEVANALKPLFTYFDDNFAIMNQTLTQSAMIMVMTRLWKEVLTTIEALLVPPLSDKPSQQRQLSQQETDIVFKWLQYLFEFFHAVDDETGEANGVPINVLRSPKYFDLTSLNFFYFDSTDSLIRTSERMASATAARQQNQRRDRLSAPPSLASPAFGGAAGLIGIPASTRRSKSIMLSRNLGTMKKAKEDKWKEAQAEPNDDMILRILRMRPEADRYLKDRSRQKERLAAAAAAEMIVKQSLLAGGGRMAASLPRR